MSIVALFAIAFNLSAQDWVKAEGINTQMSVTSIQEYDGRLMIAGRLGATQMDWYGALFYANL